MIQSQALSSVQQRIAQHYLGTLRRANTAIQRGYGSRVHWYSQIEQDWEQIRQWQSWAASGESHELERRRMCVDFTLAGLEVLRVRQTPAERLAWLQKALDQFPQDENSAASRTLLNELGNTYFYLSDNPAAKATAEKLLALAEAANDPFDIGRAWYVLGQIALNIGALEEGEKAMQTAADLLEQVGAEAELGRALQGVGRAALWTGQLERAKALFERYLKIVEASSREAELAPAYITMNNLLLEQRRFEEAKQYAERAIMVCHKTGFQRMLGSALLCVGVAEAELGELDAASAHYEEGLVSSKSLRATSSVIDLLRYLADARMRQGRYAEARGHLEEGLALSRELHILYYLCEITAALTRWHLDQGQVEAARPFLREAIEFAQELKSDNFLCTALLPAVMLWRQDGQPEQAATWAGVLQKYPDYVLPRLFDPLCAQLEQELGAERYQRAVEHGKTSALKETVEHILTLLGGSTPS